MPLDTDQPDDHSLLDAVMFTAKIDYLKIETPGHVELPPLNGKPRWSRKEHCRSLTVHDASANDVLRLQQAFKNPKLLALEVAVDVRPRPKLHLNDEKKDQLLRRFIVEVVAWGLDPQDATGINKKFRALYRHLPLGGRILLFNRRTPQATDQQLHGGKHDSCQVKSYYKRRDMGVNLCAAQHVVRVEVTLTNSSLYERGLVTLGDLFGFRFRRELTPFFTHVKGTKRRAKQTRLPAKWQAPIAARRQRDDEALWRKNGVGAFKEGGRGEPEKVRLLRDLEVNNRVGQALGRLEAQFRPENFVCF